MSRLVPDSRSISSRASNHTEYEVWRRWEDCLDFQSTLETEYEQLSRQKVKVLKRGGKKHDAESIYSQVNGASSFDSLPEGPDPREVALNVHDLIPPLSKKGTLFRPSRATIEQRSAEFAAMMRGLFNPDPEAPVLLKELRNSQAVRDFFGYWRRDKEMAEKYGAKMMHSNRSMSSVLPSSGQDYPPLPSPASTASPPTTPITPASLTEAARVKQYATATVLAQEPRQKPHPHGDSYFPVSPIPPPVPTSTQPMMRKSSAPPSYNPPKSLPEELIAATDKMHMREAFSSPQTWQARDSSATNNDAEHKFHHRLPHQPPPPVPPLSTRPPSAGTSELTYSTIRPRSNSTNVSDYRRAHPHEAEIHPMPVRRPDGPTAQPVPPVATGHALHTFSSNPSLRDRHERTLRSPPSSSNFSQATSISSRFSNISLNRSSVNSSISGFTHMSKSSHQADMYEEGESDYDDISSAFPSPPLSSHRTPLSNIDEGHPTPSEGAYRDFRASVASVRTEVSADGVLPPHLREAWGLDDERNERGSYVDPYSACKIPLYIVWNFP